MRTGYITTVKSNLKVGCDVVLGPKTLIVGRNGKGKSSIIGAVELALTGRVSDVGGKESIAVSADLLQLIPGRTGLLWVDALTDADEKVSYRMEGRGPGKGSEPKRELPHSVNEAIAHPIRMVLEGFSSVAKARKFLVDHSDPVAPAEVLGHFPGPLQPLFKQAAKGISAKTPVEALRGVHERARKKRLELNKAAKNTAVAVDHATEDVVPPTAAQLAAARSALEAAQEALDAAKGARNAVHRVTQQEAHVAQLSEALDAAITAKATALRYERAAHMLDLLEMTRDKKLSACPMCRQPLILVVPSDEMSEEERVAFDEQQIVAHWVNLCEKVAGAVAKFKPQRLVDVGVATARLEDAKVQLERLRETAASAPDDEAMVQLSLSSKMAAATLESMVRRQAAFEAMRKVRDAGFMLESDANRWKQLEEACDEVMTKIAKQQEVAFCARVQKHLPPDDAFGLMIGEGGRDVVHFGLMREGVLHSALSGAEWARVTSAIASVIIGDSRLSVIMPEERAYDPETLAEVLRALADAPCQVLLTSPILPKGRLPKGWTLVEVGDDAQEEYEAPAKLGSLFDKQGWS